MSSDDATQAITLLPVQYRVRDVGRHYDAAMHRRTARVTLITLGSDPSSKTCGSAVPPRSDETDSRFQLSGGRR